MAVNVWGVDTTSNVVGVKREVLTAVTGQTLFTLLTFTYTIGNNALTVYVNGVMQFRADSYLETSTSSITFTEALEPGDKVLFEVRGV